MHTLLHSFPKSTTFPIENGAFEYDYIFIVCIQRIILRMHIMSFLNDSRLFKLEFYVIFISIVMMWKIL